jgi:hypothetical protein
MATLGPRDTSTLVNLTGWDAAELKKYDLQNNTAYTEIVGMLNAGLSALNSELASGLWGEMISFQDTPQVEYRVGTSNGFEEHTEYGRPDAARSATEGHMLPLKAFDRRLGWTWDYLRKSQLPQIEADIQDALKDARDLWRQKLLTRVLKRGDDSGAREGLGSSGYSPGFATTAASTSVDFTPPTWGGTAFASTHEHYVGIAGGAFTNAVFTDAKDELREHGHEPPYIFLIGPSDEATVKALTNFTPAAESLIRYGANISLATVSGLADVAGMYSIGTISDFDVRVVSGMPQYYGFAFKTYGQLSQRNPLRIRLDKGVARVQFTAVTDPLAGSAMYPIQNLMLFSEFGVGVYDRTNGTPRYVNNTTWTDGTPT